MWSAVSVRERTPSWCTASTTRRSFPLLPSRCSPPSAATTQIPAPSRFIAATTRWSCRPSATLPATACSPSSAKPSPNPLDSDNLVEPRTEGSVLARQKFLDLVRHSGMLRLEDKYGRPARRPPFLFLPCRLSPLPRRTFTLSRLYSADPKPSSVSPLECADPKSRGRGLVQQGRERPVSD